MSCNVQVVSVRDDQLPEGTHAVMVEMADGDRVLILTDTTAVRWSPPRNLGDLWRIKSRDDTVVLREVAGGC